MKRKLQKNIILFFLLFFLFSASLVFAQMKGLEVDYPGFEPTGENLLPEYIKYIYTFIIIGAGAWAFWYLIEAGYRYITSAGDPEKLKRAKEQILAVFWGIIILLASYLILVNINPQLTLFKLKTEKIDLLMELPEEPPSVPPAYTNYLWRITEIANTTKNIVQGPKGITETAQEIYSLTSNCNCSLTVPLCLCRSYLGGECQALYCYSASSTQPCPDNAEIKKKQQDVIASLSEILYYKNRGVAEREDFLLETENLDKKIVFYQEKISVEKKDLQTITGEQGRRTQERIIAVLEEEKARLEQKRTLYHQLGQKFQELISLIDGLSLATDKLSKLPDGIPEQGILGCLENVAVQCVGSCAGGCHDTLECAPVSCDGGNPCPIAQIGTEKNTIDSFANRILGASNEILRIVQEIIIL